MRVLLIKPLPCSEYSGPNRQFNDAIHVGTVLEAEKVEDYHYPISVKIKHSLGLESFPIHKTELGCFKILDS